MKAKPFPPAAVASSRDGLELSVTRVEGPPNETVRVAVGGAALTLEFARGDSSSLFSYGKLTWRSPDPTTSRAFVDAVAHWLDLELDEATTERCTLAAVECSWVRLGEGDDADGTRWHVYKLFLSRADRYAELFLRLSDDCKRAQLIEKWAKYRVALVELLEQALTPASARRAQLRRTAETPSDRLVFSAHGEFQFEIPIGFRLTHRPEGHWRVADSEDEMMIELSALRLPPLPALAPNVEGRLRALVEGSEPGSMLGPIATFERAEVAFAWLEYTFDSRDTKRPGVAARAAYGRWLIASNAWTQVLVTGCAWQTDATRFTNAWDALVESLRLAGRLVRAPNSNADA